MPGGRRTLKAERTRWLSQQGESIERLFKEFREELKGRGLAAFAAIDGSYDWLKRCVEERGLRRVDDLREAFRLEIDEIVAERWDDRPEDADASDWERLLAAAERDADPARDKGWVGANLHLHPARIDPKTVPSRLAVNGLRHLKQNPHEQTGFWKDYWSRSKQVETAANPDESSPEELADDELLKQLEGSLGGGTDAVLPSGS